MSRGLKQEGINALDITFGDAEPIGRDAIFCIASITKPIAGVAAMLLIEDGATASGLTGILLTQRMMTSPEPTELVDDFWAAAYAAIDA